MLIFLNVINPTNLTNLSDRTSEVRENSNVNLSLAFIHDSFIATRGFPSLEFFAVRKIHGSAKFYRSER